MSKTCGHKSETQRNFVQWQGQENENDTPFSSPCARGKLEKSNGLVIR